MIVIIDTRFLFTFVTIWNELLQVLSDQNLNFFKTNTLVYVSLMDFEYVAKYSFWKNRYSPKNDEGMGVTGQKTFQTRMKS